MGILSMLLGKKQKEEPRLTMVSELRRCKRSDSKLRAMLYEMSNSHCEEVFALCGFPYWDRNDI